MQCPATESAQLRSSPVNLRIQQKDKLTANKTHSFQKLDFGQTSVFQNSQIDAVQNYANFSHTHPPYDFRSENFQITQFQNPLLHQNKQNEMATTYQSWLLPQLGIGQLEPLQKSQIDLRQKYVDQDQQFCKPDISRKDLLQNLIYQSQQFVTSELYRSTQPKQAIHDDQQLPKPDPYLILLLQKNLLELNNTINKLKPS